MAGWASRLLLAYALLLQMVLSSAAMVQHTGVPATDLWGATCTGTPSPAGTPAPQDGGPPHQGLCCVLGCMAGPSPLLSPTDAAELQPAPRITKIAFPTRVAYARAGDSHHAFHARGPPARV
ncbi:hypothetical protein V5F77_21805 [Xanthobacter sp. DSM 24535]|uniref:hypothetical protein n=1 Tax=Roseixanthobacter psychrophilus TaxID=3119917 RepID=UPI00372AA019